jgi:hypothetical protein
VTSTPTPNRSDADVDAAITCYGDKPSNPKPSNPKPDDND